MSQNHPQQPDSANEEEVIRSRETSILFSPFMVWMLLACLLLAIWFKFLPLIAVSTFLLILAIVIITWKEQSLKNLIPTLVIPKSRLFAEEEFTVDATVKNNKWLPLIWLEWEFQRSDVIHWGDNNGDTYVIRFLWLLWYQKIGWTVEGKALKRGVYDLGQVTLRSGDGFRFAEKEQGFDLNNQLYIYPKLLPVHLPVFRPSLQWEVQGKQGGFLEDPLLINGIRDYEAGDEWQRFNWRASARTGKMQTNVYQPVVSEQLNIYIDVQGFVINEEKYEDNLVKQQQYMINKRESFERFLSIIASTAVVYQERGMSIGFSSNGLNHLGHKLSSTQPSKQLTPLLDQLAQMTQHVVVGKMAALDEIVHNGKRSVPLFIFCERITNEHLLWYEQHQRKFEIHFYYLFTNKNAVKLMKVANQIDDLLANKVESGS